MTESSNAIVIDLLAALDPDSAAVLVEHLKTLPRSAEVRLNAAAVTSVSLRYLQVLLSVFKTFTGAGIAGATAEFADVFAGYGLVYPEASGTTAMAAEPDTTSANDAAQMPLEEPATTALVEAPLPTPEPEQAAPALLAEVPTASEPLDKPATAAQPDNKQTEGVAMPKTILTIDDSRTMRDMLKMALGSAGFTVVQAVDGEDGLNVLAQQPVDLIITDINMPKLDGFGVIRAVRGDPAHNDTPILVLSTEGEQESKDIAKDAGATGWIVKPFDPDGLVNLVNQVCG